MGQNRIKSAGTGTQRQGSKDTVAETAKQGLRGRERVANVLEQRQGRQDIGAKTAYLVAAR